MDRQLPPGPRRLPAGTCISHAVASVRNNIAYAFRISWPWYAVMTPIVIVLSGLLSYATGGNPESNPGVAFLINMAIAVITMLVFASIAVNWHRYILLDEVPQGGEIFRLDGKTWRYFGNLLLLSLIMLGVGFAVGLPLGFIGGLVGAIGTFLILIVLIVLPIVGILALRLGVKLPAIALGRTDFFMRDAWAVTKENSLPVLLIFLFEVLVAAGAGLALFFIAYAAGAISPALGVAIAFVLQLVLNWVFTIFSITVLTSLYGFFVEHRDF